MLDFTSHFRSSSLLACIFTSVLVASLFSTSAYSLASISASPPSSSLSSSSSSSFSFSFPSSTSMSTTSQETPFHVQFLSLTPSFKALLTANYTRMYVLDSLLFFFSINSSFFLEYSPSSGNFTSHYLHGFFLSSLAPVRSSFSHSFYLLCYNRSTSTPVLVQFNVLSDDFLFFPLGKNVSINQMLLSPNGYLWLFDYSLNSVWVLNTLASSPHFLTFSFDPFLSALLSSSSSSSSPLHFTPLAAVNSTVTLLGYLSNGSLLGFYSSSLPSEISSLSSFSSFTPSFSLFSYLLSSSFSSSLPSTFALHDRTPLFISLRNSPTLDLWISFSDDPSTLLHYNASGPSLLPLSSPSSSSSSLSTSLVTNSSSLSLMFTSSKAVYDTDTDLLYIAYPFSSPAIVDAASNRIWELHLPLSSPFFLSTLFLDRDLHQLWFFDTLQLQVGYFSTSFLRSTYPLLRIRNETLFFTSTTNSPFLFTFEITNFSGFNLSLSFSARSTTPLSTLTDSPITISDLIQFKPTRFFLEDTYVILEKAEFNPLALQLREGLFIFAVYVHSSYFSVGYSFSILLSGKTFYIDPYLPYLGGLMLLAAVAAVWLWSSRHASPSSPPFDPSRFELLLYS